MNKFLILLFSFALVAACAPVSDEAKMAESKEINCATADQDIATLEKEKANVADRVAAGARIALPPAAIIDIFYGYNQDKTEADEFFKDKNDVASGDYSDRIDQKIADIKAACGA